MAAPASIERERIVQSALRQFLAEHLGESAASVDLQLARDLSPHTAWMRWLKRAENPSLPRVELYGADATALSFLAGSNFGRPSNQIHFVDSLIEHGFLDEYGNVSPLGQQALDYARAHAPFLLDHSRIEAVEELLDRNESASVPDLVSQLCQAIGLPIEMAQSAVSDWYVSRRMPLPQTPSALYERSPGLSAQVNQRTVPQQGHLISAFREVPGHSSLERGENTPNSALLPTGVADLERRYRERSQRKASPELSMPPANACNTG